MGKKYPGIADFTGTFDNLSFYKLRGSDQIIVRQKGGADKEEIKKKESFEKTRQLNSEFGGRSAGAQWINHTMLPLKSLADYTYIGKLNAILKSVQEMDTVNPFGQRTVDLAKNPSVLNGFSLNRKNNFEHFVHVPPDVTVTKENGKAQVTIPALRNGINFYTHYDHPVFAFILSLGMVPDFDYSEYGYNRLNGEDHPPNPVWKQSEWFPAKIGSPEVTMDLEYSSSKSDFEGLTMVLSIGICFGNLAGNGKFERVKYAGAAKILLAC